MVGKHRQPTIGQSISIRIEQVVLTGSSVTIVSFHLRQTDTTIEEHINKLRISLAKQLM